MNNFSGCSSKMFKKILYNYLIFRVQIFVIYKNFASIKCHDFETELHFAGVKLGEEKRKLFNQIKMTLSRFECQEIFWMSGNICTKVYNLLAIILNVTSVDRKNIPGYLISRTRKSVLFVGYKYLQILSISRNTRNFVPAKLIP